MNRCLILLTCWYPYTKHGEQFLNSEVGYLSQCFDKVILVPCFRTANSSYVRDVPFSNIEVKRIIRQPKIFEILQSSYNLLGSKIFWSELKYLVQSRKFNAKTLKILFIATINQIIIKKKVLEELKEVDLSLYDELTFYSYWYSSLAGAVTDLKKEHIKKNLHLKVKAISRAHGTSDVYGGEDLKYYLPYRKEYYNGLDKVYPVSENATKFLSDKINEYSKFKTARLGTKDHGVQYRSSLGTMENFTIVSCSNMVNVKRIHLIIAALSAIKEHKIKWVHFGGGKLETEIREQAKQLPVNIKTEFHGAVSNKVIIDYYKEKSPHLFINVSESEGIPVSIIEAMSFGIPIIATDVGGTSEAVVENHCGYLLDKYFEINELSRLILTFIKMDSKVYDEFKGNCRNYWEINFKEENNYLNFCKDIQNI